MQNPAHPISATKIPCFGFESNQDAACHVAQMVANMVRERNAFGQTAVLGVPTT